MVLILDYIRTSNSSLIHLKSELLATKLLDTKRIDTFFPCMLSLQEIILFKKKILFQLRH